MVAGQKSEAEKNMKAKQAAANVHANALVSLVQWKVKWSQEKKEINIQYNDKSEWRVLEMKLNST